MANTPCARLMNPIRPIVTDRPTEITYRIMPKAAPWKATLTSEERNSARGLLLLLQLFPGILHRGSDRLELDVGELAADLLHLAQVFVLDDVACLRIDRDRSPRAVRALVVLEHLHRLVGVELAVLRLDRLEDHGDAVPGAGGEEVGHFVGAVLLLPGGDEGLVGGTVRGSRIVMHGQH